MAIDDLLKYAALEPWQRERLKEITNQKPATTGVPLYIGDDGPLQKRYKPAKKPSHRGSVGIINTDYGKVNTTLDTELTYGQIS